MRPIIPSVTILLKSYSTLCPEVVIVLINHIMYGMSLYLCWASMVLSGVAVAIYAFATCLLCAEYKMLREKRHFLDDGSGMYYQNGSQKMVTGGSNRSSQNNQKQTKSSQKSNGGKNPGYKYSEVSNHVASTHTTPSSKCNTLQFWRGNMNLYDFLLSFLYFF